MDDRTGGGRLLLTVAETCDALGIGRSMLYKLFSEGRIRPVHIGRAVRVPVSELARYVAGLESERDFAATPAAD